MTPYELFGITTAIATAVEWYRRERAFWGGAIPLGERAWRPPPAVPVPPAPPVPPIGGAGFLTPDPWPPGTMDDWLMGYFRGLLQDRRLVL